jgi:O-acetyl-ADP-ribose deacetylase (regulator of RNase III)
MIRIFQGDLLKQDVDAIVNTVNCVGVMGKGIALQFKNKWPKNYEMYAAACKEGKVKPGYMLIYDAGGLVKPHYIINFPTKQHWKGKSKLEFIRDGLVDLVRQIERLKIQSIAIPPLGCGNGGLDWTVVRPIIEATFDQLAEVDVRLFEPTGTPEPKSMEVRTKKPRMTSGRAAILKVLETYRALNYGLSRLEIQKLAYFLQEAGEPLNLKFEKHNFGPYSDTLRHALNNMEGHYLRGVGDGVVESEIEPTESATAEAEQFIQEHDHGDLARRVARVEKLIDGFQSPYGMELLASVHWVATQYPSAGSVDAVVAAVGQWNDRKKLVLQRNHLISAWQRLTDEGWIPEAASEPHTQTSIERRLGHM